MSEVFLKVLKHFFKAFARCSEKINSSYHLIQCQYPQISVLKYPRRINQSLKCNVSFTVA